MTGVQTCALPIYLLLNLANLELLSGMDDRDGCSLLSGTTRTAASVGVAGKMGFCDDYDRGSERLIFDLRKGKLGTISLEKPADINAEGLNE